MREVIRLSVLPTLLTIVRVDRVLKQKRASDHIIDAVLSYPSILYQAVAECGNVVSNILLRLVKSLYALIRMHDVLDDVVKLANCMLSPPYIETLVVTRIA